MTLEELERNSSAFSEPLNSDNPIEDLWSKISNIQRVATLQHAYITNITIMIFIIEKPVSLPLPPKISAPPRQQVDGRTFKAMFQLGNKELTPLPFLVCLRQRRPHQLPSSRHLPPPLPPLDPSRLKATKM
jgi:hypothetical protein